MLGVDKRKAEQANILNGMWWVGKEVGGKKSHTPLSNQYSICNKKKNLSSAYT